MTTPADIFSKLPERVDASKIAGVSAVVVFDLSGDDGGAWTLNVDNGVIQVNEGASDGAAATINMSSADYVNMMTGNLNPMMAFMSGKIKVDGDLNTVMKLQSIMG